MATQSLCFFVSLRQYSVGKHFLHTLGCLYSAPAPSRGVKINDIFVTLTHFTADERSFVVLIVARTAMATQPLCFFGSLYQYCVGKRSTNTVECLYSAPPPSRGA